MIKEPTTDKIPNSTTLKQCGWCEYASGTHRYNYCISGRCQLGRSHDIEIKWSDKCKFIDASQSDIDAVIGNHLRTVTEAENTIERYNNYIGTLEAMNKPYRPPLPDDRKHDHFNIDNLVMVNHKGKWIAGEVKFGYRHHDGCVSYKLDGVGPQESGFWGMGYAVPTVLLRDEYQFFKDNPEQYEIWAKKAYNKSFNGNRLEVPCIQ
jgi:hypothetical protein